MHNDVETHFAPPSSGGPLQLYAYASLGMAAAICFLALFLKTPIATEARDYVFYRGYLAQSGDLTNLIYPVGANRRLVSMTLFALSRDACGFGVACLNTIQIALLMLCMIAGAVHLHQLLRRPVLVASSMALWCLSLPVFETGFWQATQHDKLAFLFSVTALSYGLSALRRQPAGRGLVLNSVVLLALFVLAMNSKEIAFCLPVAAAAQIFLLGPPGSLQQRVQAGRVYIPSVVYAVLYICIYMLRLKAPWHGHVMGGDLSINTNFYFLSLMGRQESSAFSSVLALAILAAALAYAAFSAMAAGPEPAGRARGGLRVLAYVGVIFATNIVLVARAKFPDNCYLFLAQWAFFGCLATAFALLDTAPRVPRITGLAALSILVVIYAHKRFGDMVGGNDGELAREAHVLDADYARLRPYCGPQMAQGMKFVFPERPLGFFYFFRGGSDSGEQLIAPYLCEDGPIVPMTYAYDGNITPDRPGELLVTFNQDLSIRNISKK